MIYSKTLCKVDQAFIEWHPLMFQNAAANAKRAKRGW